MTSGGYGFAGPSEGCGEKGSHQALPVATTGSGGIGGPFLILPHGLPDYIGSEAYGPTVIGGRGSNHET
jgi:hypothetical protein